MMRMFLYESHTLSIYHTPGICVINKPILIANFFDHICLFNCIGRFDDLLENGFYTK